MKRTYAGIIREKWYSIIGFLMVCVAGIVALILQEDIVTNYHDQLDGEVLAYILHAKYLFQNVENYPELMNGISGNGLFPPAPLVTVLYKVCKPHIAYILNAVFCMICGYTGMYLCIKQFTGSQAIAALTGVLFAYLPLFSVYGLCQYGLPFLFYALYLLYNRKNTILALGMVALYGAMSSLVLVGYAVIGIGILFCAFLFYRKKWKEHIWLVYGILLLTGVYLIFNSSLVLQVLGFGNAYPSHKEVIVRYGQNFWNSFKTIFACGTVHTAAHQFLIVIYATILCIISFFIRKKVPLQIKMEINVVYLLYGLNLFFALFYACYQSSAVAELRNQVGGIFKEFQADRLYWLSIPLWYFIFGISIDLSFKAVKWLKDNHRGVCAGGVFIILSFFTIGCSAVVYYYSDFHKNVHRLRYGEGYEQVTWGDFYASDVFEQIDEYIGEDKKEYRTLSFGIYPAAALYNGFYCLDGYSNNYSLDYIKHFRKIIAPELMKNEALRLYFDQWGCRCYLLSAELGSNRFLYPKGNNIELENLEYDFEQAKRMGARYLFSAIKLPNVKGIKLMREKPFQTDTSYYGIYLYKIV